jgi:hypothetical protein
MGHSGVEGSGCRVTGEAEDVATVDAGQPTGASDQEETQGAHAPEGEGVGPLPRARLDRRDGLELEAAQEVVGEDAQVLQALFAP